MPEQHFIGGFSCILALVGLLLFSSCSLFETRTPEDPITGAGTFAQPDTPEQVIENIKAAIEEMNTLNYRRSLSENLKFRPTATAEARESIFQNWGRVQEEQYFSALAAAASMNEGHSLSLEIRGTNLGDTRMVLDATYRLRVNHRRPDAATEVQGQLQWIIIQNENGLWELGEWTDQELGNASSWSDLKAEFMN